MRKSILALLLALFAIMALAAPIYAEDDDDDDEDEEEENEASSESDSGSEEKSTPGFEFLFAAGAALAGARLIRSRIN
jgi:hypothetical protein